MQQTKITYKNHAKQKNNHFLLSFFTGTKANNMVVYKQQTHSMPSTRGGSLSS
jgi:hypothetical protein